MKIGQYRDIQVMTLSDGEVLLFAADTSAAIGQKAHDQLQVPPQITSQMAARVVLMEVLSLGGQPAFVMNLVGNEMEPTGRQLLEGLQAELTAAGFSNLPINGSSEENMTTTMTSLGLILVANAQAKDLRMHRVQAGHRAYQVGQPYIGSQVLDHWQELPTYQDLAWLNQFDLTEISEIVPIGSQGSLNEAQQVAQMNDLTFHVHPKLSYGESSAGPATSWLVVGSSQIFPAFQARFNFVEEIGVYHD